MQCAIAKRPTPALVARELELLVRAAEWAALGEDVRPIFVRGFVERIDVSLFTLETRGSALLAGSPLVSHVRITNLDGIVQTEELQSASLEWAKRLRWLRDALAVIPRGRLRVLAARPEIVQLDNSYDPSQTVHRYDDDLRDATRHLGLEQLVIE